MKRPARTSPCRWSLARGLSEVLAQVGLVRKAAPKRNVTQRCIGRQHVLGGQFHASSHEESMRCLPEGALEGAGEVRFAAIDECAKIGDEHRSGDMTIDIVTYLVRLPGEQSLTAIWSLLRGWWIDLLSQQ